MKVTSATTLPLGLVTLISSLTAFRGFGRWTNVAMQIETSKKSSLRFRFSASPTKNVILSRTMAFLALSLAIWSISLDMSKAKTCLAPAKAKSMANLPFPAPTSRIVWFFGLRTFLRRNCFFIKIDFNRSGISSVSHHLETVPGCLKYFLTYSSAIRTQTYFDPGWYIMSPYAGKTAKDLVSIYVKLR